MKAYIAVVFVLALCGCVSQAPVCNRPYIVVGTGCCLDENSDAICDVDKPPTTLPPTTSTTTQTTTTTTTATTTSTTTSTLPPTTSLKPRPQVAVIDVQKPDGKVVEVQLTVGSPEKSIVGDVHLAAFPGAPVRILVWDSLQRVVYEKSTGKVYLPPDYDTEVSPFKLQNLSGEATGDNAFLGDGAYYVYSAKPDRLILAKGRFLDDLDRNFTSEFSGYKFKFYGMQ
jgi:hypothetical protein